MEVFRWALPDTAHRGSGTQKTPGPHSPVQPWIGYRCPLDRFDVRVRHDIAMATVWVSSTSADVDVDEDRPGDHWQRVGVIDTSAQRDFYTYIQQYIGVRKTTKGKPEFYLSGDPESAWVQQVKENVSAAAVLDPHQPLRVRPDPLQQRKYQVSSRSRQSNPCALLGSART